jgi:hypothetical protein
MLNRRSFMKMCGAVVAMPLAILKAKPATGGIVSDEQFVVLNGGGAAKSQYNHVTVFRKEKGKVDIYIDGMLTATSSKQYVRLIQSQIEEEVFDIHLMDGESCMIYGNSEGRGA